MFRIRIPPLRERLEDIDGLVIRTIGPTAERLGVAPPRITASFLRRLGEHAWPGNVRELQNTIERVCVQYPGRVLEEQLLESIFMDEPELEAGRAAESSPAGRLHYDELEDPSDALKWPRAERPRAELLAATLRSTGGNVARAARRLGVPRSTLRYWIRLRGLIDMIPRD